MMMMMIVGVVKSKILVFWDFHQKVKDLDLLKVMFVTFYHGNQHGSPPFERICVLLFRSVKQSQIQGKKTMKTIFFLKNNASPTYSHAEWENIARVSSPSSRVVWGAGGAPRGQVARICFTRVGGPMEVIVSYVSKLGYNSPIYGTFLPTYLYREYNPLILSTSRTSSTQPFIMECHKDFERLLAWSMWPQPK